MGVFDRTYWFVLLLPIGLLGCTVELAGQCADDVQCPRDQVCRLGGCVVANGAGGMGGEGGAGGLGGMPDMGGSGGMPDMGGSGGMPDMGGSGGMPDMGGSGGMPDMGGTGGDGGGMAPVLTRPAGPVSITQTGINGPHIIRFAFDPPDTIEAVELSLTPVSAGCADGTALSVRLSAGAGNDWESDARHWEGQLSRGCEAQFQSSLNVTTASGDYALDGPDVLIDNAAPPYVPKDVEVWPLEGESFQVHVRTPDGIGVDLFTGACPESPDASPAGRREPAPIDLPDRRVWHFEDPDAMRSTLVLADAFGNLRCEPMVEHRRPRAISQIQAYCSPDVAAAVAIADAEASQFNPTVQPCLTNRDIVARPGHRRILNGGCPGWPSNRCTTFIRHETPDEVTFQRIDLQRNPNPTPSLRGPQILHLPDFDAVSQIVFESYLLVGDASGRLAIAALVDDRPGPARIQNVGGGGPIHLTAATHAGVPVFYLGNFEREGHLARCTLPGGALNCTPVYEPGEGAINDLVAADFDADGDDEVMLCQPDAMRVLGMGAPADRVVPGPPLTVNDANPPCVRVVAGQLRPNGGVTAITEIAGGPVGRLVSVHDWNGNRWLTKTFNPLLETHSAVIADANRDGLDELFVVTAPGSISRVRLRAERLETLEPLVELPASISAFAMVDFDRDGMLDLMGVADGGLFYQIGDQLTQTPVEALHLEAAGDTLLAFQRQRLALLRPHGRRPQWHWPAMPLNAGVPANDETLVGDGHLVAGGFDLNANGIDEVLWVREEAQQAVSADLYEWDGVAMRRLAIGSVLPPLSYRATLTDINGDGVDDLTVLGRQQGDVTLRHVNGTVRQGGALGVARWTNVPFADTQITDLAGEGNRLFLLAAANAGTGVVRIINDARGDGFAFNTSSLAIAQYDDALALMGCDDLEGVLLHLPLDAEAATEPDSTDLSGRCLAAAGLQTPHASSPQPVLITRERNQVQVRLMLGMLNAQPAFGPPLALPALAGVTRLVTADLDGDLRTDLLFTEAGAEGAGVRPRLTLLRFDDDGRPTRIVDDLTAADEGIGANHAVAGDFDGDGLRDILVQTQGVDAPAQLWLVRQQ